MDTTPQQFEEADTSVSGFLILDTSAQSEKNLKLARHLVAKASSSNISLSSLRFVALPPPKGRLQRWTYWLASEVIAQWRQSPHVDRSIGMTLQNLGLSQDGDKNLLLAELDKAPSGERLSSHLLAYFQFLQVQQQQLQLERTNLHRWIEVTYQELIDRFTYVPPLSSLSATSLSSNYLVQLQANALVVRSQTLDHLKTNLAGLWHKGPQVFREWLTKLVNTLQEIQTTYETQRQECIKRENSAWKAFQSLYKPSTGWRRWLEPFQPVDWAAVLNALAVSYGYKLESETYTQAVMVVAALIQQVQSYAATVTQTDTMLVQLQNELSAKSNLEPVHVLILRDYLAEHLSIDKLRRDLEGDIGRSLSQWGTSDMLQSSHLLDRVLAHVQPLTLQIYADCCYQAITLCNQDLYPQPALPNHPVDSLPSTPLPSTFEPTSQPMLAEAFLKTSLNGSSLQN
jgi:hypothetical protein